MAEVIVNAQRVDPYKHFKFQLTIEMGPPACALSNAPSTTIKHWYLATRPRH
jgi:hypothetical protein